MVRLWSCSSSYTARTEPLELFSMGSTPNLHRPDSTADTTAWKVLTYTMLPRGSSRSQATWELAPSTPWASTSLQFRILQTVISWGSIWYSWRFTSTTG